MPKKGKKGGKGKGKGKVKELEEIHPPPLHALTDLYNRIEDEVEKLNVAKEKSFKKLSEGWYMTKELMDIRHDNAVYHQHQTDNVEKIARTINEMDTFVHEQQSDIDRIVAGKLEECTKTGEEAKKKMAVIETELNEVKDQLTEFEPQMAKLIKLIRRHKEIDEELKIQEYQATLKTRRLKNEYLTERANLHNHMGKELHKVVTKCRAHLIPVLANHMRQTDVDNQCKRFTLNLLDKANFNLIQRRDDLMEERSTLMIEEPYLSTTWLFQKLHEVAQRKKKERMEAKKKKVVPKAMEECELSIAFKSYYADRLMKHQEALKKAKRKKKMPAKTSKVRFSDEESKSDEDEEPEDEVEEEEEYLMQLYNDLLAEYNGDWDLFVQEYKGDIPLEAFAELRKILAEEVLQEEEEEDEEEEYEWSEGSSDAEGYIEPENAADFGDEVSPSGSKASNESNDKDDKNAE